MRRLSLAVVVVGILGAGCNCGGTPPDPPDAGQDAGLPLGGDAGTPQGPCTAPAACYTGPVGTAGLGACRAGTAQCVDGVYGPCIGQVQPAVEACNGADDDCDGTVDDPAELGTASCGLGACRVTVAACASGAPAFCTPGAPSTEVCGDAVDNNCDGAVDEGCGCAYVAPFGADTNPGTPGAPLRTIRAGITVAVDAGFAQVCVGAALACPANAGFPEALTMANGVSVLGAFLANDAGTPWTRQANCTTRINAQDDRGVYFGPTVTRPTALDGFTVVAGNQATNAAVTVEGSTGAVVNNCLVTGGSGQNSVGINVQASGGTAATPSITRSAITGGAGQLSAIGVRSNGSRPTIADNCSTFGAQGRCNQGCFGSTRFILGRAPITGVAPGAASIAVRLENSPGAVVQRSALCSGPSATTSAGVHLSGDGKGTVVRASVVEGNAAGANSVAVWADGCAGASPWLFDNTLLAANSPTPGARADGVRAVGDCHVRVDSNQRIVGGEESSNNDAIGVYCAKDPVSGVSSRCTVQNNALILGSAFGLPPRSTGVRCDVGACALIERNRISGRAGQQAFGVVLEGTDTLVRRNGIEAGCATVEGVGVLAVDALARLENNALRGSVCDGGTNSPPLTHGVKVQLGAGANEVDLHSNSIIPFGSPVVACSSRGVTFELVDGGTAAGPRGILRNNILHGGACPSSLALDERVAGAAPRLLEHNDLWTSDGGGLYRDDGSAVLPSVTLVNALPGALNNLAADPAWDGGVGLLPTSVCRNAGTAVGAPTDDLDGESRPQESAPDIGADEYRP